MNMSSMNNFKLKFKKAYKTSFLVWFATVGMLWGYAVAWYTFYITMYTPAFLGLIASMIISGLVLYKMIDDVELEDE